MGVRCLSWLFAGLVFSNTNYENWNSNSNANVSAHFALGSLIAA